MSESQVRSLARRLASLEKWRLQSKQPNLGFSTIEAGALQTTDEDGVVRQVFGQQDDGTYTIVDVNGPTPPTPVAPSLQAQPGLLVVSSYGLTVDGSQWPRDFHRLDVHVGAAPGFEPTIATRITQFSIEGGSVSLALDAGTYYAKLVAVSTSGTKSSSSAEASAVVPEAAQGEQGVPGPPGDPGQSLYTWVKYADSPTTGMSDDPTGKAYLGIAYNKTTALESSTYSDYEWTLVEGPAGADGADGPQGDQGIPGPPGDDGQPTYTWVKYGDNASGAGLSDSPTGKTYIGLAYNKTTATESTTATDYQWALIQGEGRVYRTSSPPTGLVAGDVATWYDTDNDNLQNYWDGDSWEPVPLGPGATTDDIIAGKRLPLNTSMELQWGVPDPNNPPQFPYASLEPMWPGDGTNSSSSGYHGLTLDGTRYVQIQRNTDPVTNIHYYRPVFTDATTGAITYGPNLDYLSTTVLSGSQNVNKFMILGGPVKIGTSWYILLGGTFHTTARGHLVRYDESWNLVSATDVGGSTGVDYIGLGTDGTNLLTMSDTDTFGGGTAPTNIHIRTTAWAVVSDVVTNLTNLTPSTGILPLANYDYGAGRYIVLASDGASFVPTYYAVALNSSGVEQDRFKLLTGVLGSSPVTGIRWNSTTSRFEFGANYGEIYRTTASTTDKNVWSGYSYYDSLADPDVHESALSPVSASVTVVPKRNGLMINESVPDVDDIQAPDTLRVYGRVGDATQPAKADMDLQSAVEVPWGSGSVSYKVIFVTNPANGGAAPPTVSSFPVGASGEITSEQGGLAIRGDGTGDWPYLRRQIEASADGRYSLKDHSHPTTDGLVSKLATDTAALDTRLDTIEPTVASHSTSITNEATARAAADNALDARLDTIEAGGGIAYATATVTIPGGNTYTGSFTFTKIGNLVFANGYVDRATGSSATSHIVAGLQIPVGFRPAAGVVAPSFTAWNTTSTYRYRFQTNGDVEIQQSAAIGVFQAISISWSV